jgi:hypothetical protein
VAAPLPPLLTDSPIELAPFSTGFRRVGDLTALLDRAEPRVRRRFLEMIGKARGLRTLDQIATLIERGQIDAALAAIERAVPSFVSSLEQAYTEAGQSLAAALEAPLGTLLDFDSVNDRAVASLQVNRARLIRELTTEQRAATLQMLEEFADLGTDPRVQARLLRGSFGLTRRQVAAVGNYRRLLQNGSAEALTRALRDKRFDSITIRATLPGSLGGEPLTRAQIDRMVARYQERYIAYRARVIARTETLRAVNEGQEEMIRQAIASGAVRPEQVQRVWRTARDERVRGSHRTMEGQVRALDDAFVSGRGAVLRYPGDPAAPPSETVQCRCVVAVAVPRLDRRRQQQLTP